jgi:tRNA (Thr-GGU) A37 N-methylase
MGEIKYKPIGIIRSPFEDIHGMPIQPTGARGIAGSVEIAPEYADGLQDIEGFSHIILIYHFHRCDKSTSTPQSHRNVYRQARKS